MEQRQRFFMAASMVPLIILNLQATLSTSSPSYNVVDNCWRRDPNWAQNRMKLADCGVGFGSTAKGGKGGELYTVSPDDDAVNPLPGSLRYGVTRDGPLWIVFASDMKIMLEMPLFVASHKTIDARGSNVHISNGPCIRLLNVSNIIIHGLNIHDWKPSVAGDVLVSQSMSHEMMNTQDGDAISVVSSRDIWIDHNYLSSCADGLVDITLASTAVTISNNRFTHHDKVMLLGHSDDYTADKNMRVTVAFNHFGPGLLERMPRCRHGYAHVANNNYEAWGIYAIGGSANPMIRSECNCFVAPNEEDKKQVTWRETPQGKSWLWKSVRDTFLNGAYFVPSDRGKALPLYQTGQQFKVANGRSVPILTQSAGVLACATSRACI
ncbi:hypothetical protein SUGI_0565880 [Cryptomeria japonica]|uniref:pectate lyase 1-like n=1 Tax=Cryptomeria japonica TaxID=3369 RepID=UPI00240896C0|nr:pectate lyase 1-like [Cryptomeria japonica]GLJ28712.1 hypothetical protein SUGI_0565880 [Cryptomeria japonica]